MKRSELRELIKEIVTPVVDEAITPLKEQQTSWMQKLSDSRSASSDVAPLGKGDRAARFVRAIAAGKGDPGRAASIAKKWWGDDNEVTKALAAGDPQAGGVLVPPSFSTEVIELLRAMTAVRSLNPRSIPMPNGTITMPKHTGGTTTSYIGENQNIGVTEPTTGMLTLTWKKLAAIVPISNDLLLYDAIGADTLVRDDLTDSMALREDLAFLRGDGLNNTPKGIREWMPTANQLTVASFSPTDATAPTLAEMTELLSALILQLVEANIRMVRPGWIMAPRTMRYLMDLRDGNGNFAYRTEMVGGTLEGFPFRSTNQVPINLGGGSDESELYLTDFADVIIGESTDLLIDSSSEAAYHDGSNVQAAFSRDQTIIRVIARHDLGMRHEESATMFTDVRWGA